MDSGADDLVVDQATQPPHSLVEEGRKLAGTCSACLRPHLAQSGGFRIESKNTPTWQFSVPPAVPEYCRLTPTDLLPLFRNPVSSPMSTPSGSPKCSTT